MVNKCRLQLSVMEISSSLFALGNQINEWAIDLQPSRPFDELSSSGNPESESDSKGDSKLSEEGEAFGLIYLKLKWNMNQNE